MKAMSLQWRFQSLEQVKIRWSQQGEYRGCSRVVTLFVDKKKFLDQTRLLCWSIVMKEKPTVDSPFLWAFFSDHIPKVIKDVNVHFFIYSSNSCKLCQ